ncbi:hypothetical protein AB0B86_25540 [Micromonospora sp. NPDC049047]
MNAAQQLAAMPVAEVVVDRAIVLDWYDGPLEGFARLAAVEAVWHFRVIAERTGGDLPDDRLYQFSQVVATDALDRLDEALGGAPDDPLWIPEWAFPDHAARQHADRLVADLIDHAAGQRVIIRSVDLRLVDALWVTTGKIANGIQ